MHQNAVILLERDITVPEIKPSPGSSNQKTPCWSNSDPGPMVGPNQFQMNLQIQTESPGVFILNLISHYYSAKYNSSSIPRMSLTQRLP